MSVTKFFFSLAFPQGSEFCVQVTPKTKMREMCFQSDKARIKIVNDLEHENFLKN